MGFAMSRSRLWLPLLLGAGAVSVLRRWGRRWGATDAEVGGSLPGDGVVLDAKIQWTYALTVRAVPKRTWPWIVQMGYYRGGWYTDTAWWDYLADRYLRFLVRDEEKQSGVAHRDELSAVGILPEYQEVHPGDVILDGPPGTAYFTVAAVEPNRYLVLYSTSHLRYLFPRTIRDNPRLGIGGEFSWAFVLTQTDDGRSRLIMRTRANVRPPLYKLFTNALLPLVSWIYGRKVLTAIKRRAEASE
jgi:proline iminopeptidase